MTITQVQSSKHTSGVCESGDLVQLLTPRLPVNANKSAHKFPGCATDLRCELVTEFSRLEELSTDWERLWRSSRSEIFQGFAWMRAFWKAWGSRLSLCTLVVYDDVEVVGILPLANDGKKIRYLAEGDYNDLICQEHLGPAVLATAIKALLEMPACPTTCILDNINADSRIVRHLPSLPRKLRQKLDLVFAYPCPAIVAEHGHDVFATLARKDSLRRHQNKLQREGSLTFRHLESRQEIHQHLSGFFQRQIARRALLGQRSHFQDPAERAFYAALVDELDPRSELRFSVLELKGKPVAYHFGFQLNGKFIWYQSGFDVDLWHCSPGEVLIRKLLEYAHEAHLRELDLTVGGEMYKHRFANLIRNNFTLYVDRQSSSLKSQSRRLKIFTKSAGRQIKEELKTRPRIYNAIKSKWLQAADFVSQQRRLLQHAGMTEYARLVFSGIFRSAIFGRNEALVFSLIGRELSKECTPHNPGTPLEIRPGSFSELALLSLKYPDEFPWSKLHTWRKRLATGDRVYMVHINGDLAHLAWTATRNTVCIAELDAWQLPLSHSTMVIDGYWSAPGFRDMPTFQDALRLLVYTLGDKRDVWTYLLNPDKTARRAIEAVGFRLRNRVVQIRFLHALRRSWVLHPTTKGEGR